MIAMPDQRASPDPPSKLIATPTSTPASTASLRADFLAWSESVDRATAASRSGIIGPLAVSAGVALLTGALVGRTLGRRAGPRSGPGRVGVTLVRLALAAKAALWIANNVSKLRR